MVKKSINRGGLHDWLIQRVSAVVLAAYSVFLVVYCVIHPHMDYAVWRGLFANPAMRIFNLMALLSLVAHAWIGMWTIGTDYLKLNGVRLGFQVVVALILVACLLWGIQIFWRI